MECSEFRLLAGGDPRHLDPEAEAHGAACPRCAEFLRQTLGMDAVLRRALEVPVREPVAEPRKVVPFPAAARVALGDRRRWMALAASIVGGVLVGSLLWVSGPRASLAEAVIGHMSHEPEAMTAEAARPDSAEVERILERAGVRLRPGAGEVTYANSCLLRGHFVPHLVLRTDRGPVTVLVLRHERVSVATPLNDDGYAGTILPAGPGSIAIVGTPDVDPSDVARRIVSLLEWL
jgi:hypothetical protein